MWPKTPCHRVKRCVTKRIPACFKVLRVKYMANFAHLHMHIMLSTLSEMTLNCNQSINQSSSTKKNSHVSVSKSKPEWIESIILVESFKPSCLNFYTKSTIFVALTEISSLPLPNKYMFLFNFIQYVNMYLNSCPFS